MDITEAINNIAYETFPEDEPQEDIDHYREIMNELVTGKRERWSLYRSLHNVGDDPVKSAIQDDLRVVFDDETYALIEAIFQWNASEDFI